MAPTYTMDDARKAVEAATKQMVEEIVAVLGKLEPADLATLIKELDAGNVPVVNWRLPQQKLRVVDSRSATSIGETHSARLRPRTRSEEKELELQDRMDADILRCLKQREDATVEYIAGRIGASVGMTARAVDRLIGWGRIAPTGEKGGSTVYALA